MKGYWNRDATAEVLKEGWLTRNLGYLDAAQNFIHYRDARKTSSFSPTGKCLSEIEAHYLQSPIIKNLRNGDRGAGADKLYAVIVPNFSAAAESREHEGGHSI